jgi:hypothetical protein
MVRAFVSMKTGVRGRSMVQISPEQRSEMNKEKVILFQAKFCGGGRRLQEVARPPKAGMASLRIAVPL